MHSSVHLLNTFLASPLQPQINTKMKLQNDQNETTNRSPRFIHPNKTIISLFKELKEPMNKDLNMDHKTIKSWYEVMETIQEKKIELNGIC